MNPRIFGFKALNMAVFYAFCGLGFYLLPEAADKIINSMAIATGAALAVRGYQETRRHDDER